jgi:vacuolar-type H+-ATPase subunit I/STV1
MMAIDKTKKADYHKEEIKLATEFLKVLMLLLISFVTGAVSLMLATDFVTHLIKQVLVVLGIIGVFGCLVGLKYLIDYTRKHLNELNDLQYDILPDSD